MKVTFIYTDFGLYNQNNFNRGVAILCSCLKQKGHDAKLIHISRRISRKDFTDRIRSDRPDLVAFSFISNMFAQVKVFSRWVSQMKIPALHGGMHPTVAPEECLAQDGITAVCRGEGEGAVIDFCEAMARGADIKAIPNIWVREGQTIYRNPCRDLIEDLDTLPYPDYGIFDYERLEEGRVHKILVTQASRGCRYSCTYCCNPLLRSLYRNRSRYVRYYSVDRMLDEIAWGLRQYPTLAEVRFYDDAITQNKEWFEEFAAKYKKRIGLPYSGNERVENIDAATARHLKESGCVALDIGIESGSAPLREKYMKRFMSNEKIIEAFEILRASGIRTNSFNILGMAGETPRTALETIRLNARVSPSITFNAYFYPFKGTEGYELVKDALAPEYETTSSFFERPVVRLATIGTAQMIFYYKYFFTLMRLYRSLLLRYNDNDPAVRRIEAVITSRFFPYGLFNFFHVGKDDCLRLLRLHPGLYVRMRRLYRALTRKR